jgi:hypothetical protein
LTSFQRWLSRKLPLYLDFDFLAASFSFFFFVVGVAAAAGVDAAVELAVLVVPVVELVVVAVVELGVVVAVLEPVVVAAVELGVVAFVVVVAGVELLLPLPLLPLVLDVELLVEDVDEVGVTVPAGVRLATCDSGVSTPASGASDADVTSVTVGADVVPTVTAGVVMDATSLTALLTPEFVELVAVVPALVVVAAALVAAVPLLCAGVVVAAAVVVLLSVLDVEDVVAADVELDCDVVVVAGVSVVAPVAFDDVSGSTQATEISVPPTFADFVAATTSVVDDDVVDPAGAIVGSNNVYSGKYEPGI